MKTLADAKDAAEIRDRLSHIMRDDARQWGSMSAHEMVCHVRDAYDVPVGRRTAARAPRPPIPHGLFKWLAFKAPMKWPRGAKTVPEVDPRAQGSRPGEFAADHEGLLASFSAFATWRGPFSPHPFFDDLTEAEWKRWGYLHADHHLRQFGR